MKKKVILILLFAMAFTKINAQFFSVFDVDTSSFPTIKTKFYAFDESGNQILNLSPLDFQLTEVQENRIITKLSCPRPRPLIKLSSVLTFDISGSMSENNMNIAKEAGKQWINTLLQDKNECAIVSFDENNYINQDLTNDKNKLLKAINILSSNDGTDYNAGLLNPPAGALEVVEKGIYKKVIVLFTDGLSSGDEMKIIQKAVLLNTSIYCVTLGLDCPQILKNISIQTGGQWFDNITTSDQAKEVYLKILNLAQGGEPCEIEWKSETSCVPGSIDVLVKLLRNNYSSNINYNIPHRSIKSLEFYPPFISFVNNEQNLQIDTIINVTAINSDFTVSEILSNNPGFSVTPNNINLKSGESINITLSFKPIDSAYTFAEITFINDFCVSKLNVSGGSRNKPPINNTLHLTHPNGGEEFAIGDNTLITWTGVTEQDTVMLEYSIDEGKTWKKITNTASGLKYYWKNIPSPWSNKCKIKVKQLGWKIQDDTTNNFLNLVGHRDKIKNLCWSPDGKYVATASNDTTIIIWEALTGTKQLQLIGHKNFINYVSWSPNGLYLATASNDSTAIIWDASTGKKLHQLIGHKHLIFHLSWSPNSSLIATASADQTAIIWDTFNGNKLFSLSGHTHMVNHINWSPDGLKLATASYDKTAIIWDAASGSKLRTLIGHGFDVKNICWSPDGLKVATASWDKTVIIWDPDTGEKLHTLKGHTNWINNVNWSPDGSKIASSSVDKTAIIWDANTGNLIHRLAEHYLGVSHVCWSPDGTKVATSSDDTTAIIWDAVSGANLQRLVGHIVRVNFISWNNDGSMLATASDDRGGIIWNSYDGSIYRELKGHDGVANKTIWNHDGSRVVSSSAYGSVIIWDAIFGSNLHTLNSIAGQYFSNICFSPNGLFIAASNLNKTATIWDATSGNLLNILREHTLGVNDLCWNPNGLLLATASYDNTAIIWDAIRGIKLNTLAGHTEGVISIIWSNDGQKLVTSSNDKTAIIWDGITGEQLFKLVGHSDRVFLSSWCPDSSLILTFSWDKTAKIWDSRNGTLIRTLTGHSDIINSGSWSPDGRSIATASRDKTIKIWNSLNGDLIKTLTGHRQSVEHFSWNSDGTKLATVSKDSTCIIWDVLNGTKIKMFVCNNTRIMNANWDSEDSRISLACTDGSVKIWDILPSRIILQEDESDKVFSILAPKQKSFDVNIGLCQIGKSKDSVIIDFMSNIGAAKLLVDSIYFYGTDYDCFSLVSGFPDYKLNSNQSRNIEFKFIPNRVGVHQAFIIIKTNLTNSIQKITGEGYNKTVQITNDYIDFGKIYLGYNKDTIINSVIMNVGTTKLNFTKVEIEGPDLLQFSVLEGGDDFTLNPGESRQMKLRYSAKNVGRTSGRIVFHFDGYGSPIKVQLFGETFKIVPKITTNSPICLGHDLMLFADTIPKAVYHWSGPKGFSSNLQNVIINNIDLSCAGDYKLFTTNDKISSDTVIQNVAISTTKVNPGDSSYLFIGSAERTDDYIKLTNVDKWDIGAIWLKTRFSVKQDFSTSFLFRTRYGDNSIDTIENSLPGGDGIAFVIQNQLYPVLGEKSEIGYKGITNSLAVEFDLYQNEYDPNGNHVAVQSYGDLPNIPDHDSRATLGINPDIIEIKQDKYYNVKIEYEGDKKKLKIYLDTTDLFQSPILTIDDLDLAKYLNLEDGDEYVYVGFTSTTGKAFQEHDIINWLVPCNNLYVDVENFRNNSIDKYLYMYPNPVYSRTVFHYSLESHGKVNIIITNLLGVEIVKLVSDKYMDSGRHSIEFDSRNLQAGIYFCTLSAGGNVETIKFVVVK